MCLLPRKLVIKHFETDHEYFFKFSEKCFLCFMVSYYATALISAKNIIKLFSMKHGLQFWRYILNVNYFLERLYQIHF